MKKVWYFFSILLLISIIFVFIDWNMDGFNFLKFQKQHFYFQSWISFSGILFTFIMAITTFIIYKKTKLQSLKYIPLSFLLILTSYLITGYHSSYCKICSDLGFCAASHSYPNYLFIITLLIFILSGIMFSRRLGIVEKAQALQRLSYGLIIATTFFFMILLISLKYFDTIEHSPYNIVSNNLQAFIFILPVVVIVWAFVYFRNTYKTSRIYLLMALLLCLSFLPQILHIYTCNDCYSIECSEFYVFSGFIMFIVTGIFIHSVYIQLQENSEQA